MTLTTRNVFCLLALSLTVPMMSGCGSDDEVEVCIAGTSEGCEDGLVCETVIGADEPACFAPVWIEGQVFDASDEGGIGDASVVALDANGSARTTVVSTDDDGHYSLPIAVPRDADGNPQKEFVTLRASALGYQPFPLAPRTALPVQVDEATAEAEGKPWVIANAATDVALLPLPGGAEGLGVIEGRIDIEGLADTDAAGVLVVATQGSVAVSTAVSDLHGDFVLFNVPPGDTLVEGYRSGLHAGSTTVKMEGDRVVDVVLDGSVDELATVTGSVNIVNAPGGSSTSVLLVVEATFDEAAKRGEAPAGLRAGDVTSAFQIEAVPPGRYVVLAAFENDQLVRDPDQSIGGTKIVHIEVSGNKTVEVGESFKVTEALTVVSPGANEVELVSGTPTFKWADDSSEDGYELRVFDAFGDLVHEALDVPRVTGSSTVEYTWSDAKLEAGMIYQFRVLSWQKDKKGSTSRVYISATEDLRGAFQLQP